MGENSPNLVTLFESQIATLAIILSVYRATGTSNFLSSTELLNERFLAM
jgi:hypothetical protein